MLAFPTGAEAGLYYKPSLLFSISAKSANSATAASFINFLVNDPDGIKAIGVERGIPCSRKAQSLLEPTLTATQKAELAFCKTLAASNNVHLKQVLDPPKASNVSTLFQTIAQNVGLGKTAILDGAQAFYQQALQLLG